MVEARRWKSGALPANIYHLTLRNTRYKYQVAVPSAAQCDLHCTWYRHQDSRGKIPRVLENTRCHLGLTVSIATLYMYIAISNSHDPRIRKFIAPAYQQARKSCSEIRISENGSSRLAADIIFNKTRLLRRMASSVLLVGPSTNFWSVLTHLVSGACMAAASNAPAAAAAGAPPVAPQQLSTSCHGLS